MDQHTRGKYECRPFENASPVANSVFALARQQRIAVGYVIDVVSIGWKIGNVAEKARVVRQWSGNL